MCALICGDIHGNFHKANAFLLYKPEERHVFVGDYCDAFHASDDDVMKTFKLIFDSNADKLAGNHELHYLSNAHSYFLATGFRMTLIFKQLVNAWKDKMHAALLIDDYLITHAGLSRDLGRNFDSVEHAAEWIEEEWQSFIHSPITPPSLSRIFDIGASRGGREQNGGIFWADYRCEKYEYRFNQIFGHSHIKSPKKIQVGKQGEYRAHIAIDCDEFICYNTRTHELEDFMYEEMNKFDRKFLERIF